jgi:hypothetical protein
MHASSEASTNEHMSDVPRMQSGADDDSRSNKRIGAAQTLVRVNKQGKEGQERLGE